MKPGWMFDLAGLLGRWFDGAIRWVGFCPRCGLVLREDYPLGPLRCPWCDRPHDQWMRGDRE